VGQNDLVKVCVRLYFTNSSSLLVVACGQSVILILIYLCGVILGSYSKSPRITPWRRKCFFLVFSWFRHQLWQIICHILANIYSTLVHIRDMRS
jgi:hypothetical protein